MQLWAFQLGPQRRHGFLAVDTKANLVGSSVAAPRDAERWVVGAVPEDGDHEVRGRREPVAGAAPAAVKAGSAGVLAEREVVEAEGITVLRRLQRHEVRL